MKKFKKKKKQELITRYEELKIWNKSHPNFKDILTLSGNLTYDELDKLEKAMNTFEEILKEKKEKLVARYEELKEWNKNHTNFNDISTWEEESIFFI